MAEAQTVLIEFQIDDSQLVSALERLEQAGAIDSKLAGSFKQTTTEITRQSNEIKKAASSTAPLKKNLDDVDKATKKFTQDFMEGFNEGVIDTLKEAGVSVDQFTDALKTGPTEAEAPIESLRQRLKNLTAQIAQMKLEGKDNTEEFKQMVIEAGNITDAIGDASAAIRNAGSDTQALDNLLGSAQAVAGGFAIAQGAIGLFGAENEELEKTLLKVNAAIAITQGLQSVSAALEKEGALTLLATNVQLKVKNAQKVIENGLESQSIIVRGAATVAQKALNVAMAANPIGIVTVALAGLITLLATYGRSAARAREQTTNLNVALGSGIKAFEAEGESIKRTGENAVNELENLGATESKIAARRLETDRQLNEKRAKLIDDLAQKQANNLEADLEKRQELTEKIRQLQDEQEADDARIRDLEIKQQKILTEERLKNTIAGLEAQLLAAEEGSQEQLNLQKRLISARTALELNADGLLENERKAIIERGVQEREEVEAAAQKRRIDAQLQGIEAQLINVREGSEEELKLKQQQIKLQTQSELTNTKLSEKEKEEIRKEGFEKQLKLQRDYNIRVEREAIEAQISRNNAEISNVKTSSQDRLILQIANIELAAAAEVNAANGNAAKIKEINAKRDADILAARKASIEEAAQYEIDIRTADNGPSNRALQRTISDERKSLEVRKAAIRQLAAEQIKDIDTRLSALQKEKEQQLISEEEYNLRYKQLQDKKKEINEKTEEDITAKTKEENLRRQEIAFTTLNAIATVISDINANQAEQENQRIEAEKEKVTELLEAGAITEAEAAKRNKRIEAEEKKLKREQAQRDKNLAIFNAVINTAQAITRALAAAPPPFNAILAGISAALGAAQIAAISSRPLPRFGHGKKSGYQGLAEIGETGPELYEQGGKMYLADKKQLVWLAASDKVYNPTETKEMLMPVVDKQIMQWQPPAKNDNVIDYDKLGKAVGKHINIPGFNIDEQGFKIWEQKGNERKIYMDKRYSSK